MYNLINNFMKRFFAIVFFLIGVFSLITKLELSAQSKNVVLLEGMVSELNSREPVSTEIYFIDEDNKKVKVKSEINGKFQAVLTAGRTYIVTAKEYFIDDEEAIYNTPNTTEYTETKRNFKVSKIYKGMELININAFTANNSSVNSEALSQIQRLDGILEQNLKLRVEIIVSTSDTYAKTEKKKVTETDPENSKKKITKTVNMTAEQQLVKLLEARKSNLRDIFTAMKIRESRYFFTDKLEVGKPQAKIKKKTKKDNSNSSDNEIVTLKVIISEIMKL
jgi:hypothetical protein